MSALTRPAHGHVGQFPAAAVSEQVRSLEVGPGRRSTLGAVDRGRISEPEPVGRRLVCAHVDQLAPGRAQDQCGALGVDGFHGGSLRGDEGTAPRGGHAGGVAEGGQTPGGWPGRRARRPLPLFVFLIGPVTIVNVARERHQRKQLEAALRFAEEEGCRVEVLHSGHTWGVVVAPNGQRLRVWSTPKDADVAAKMTRGFVLRNQEAPS